MAPVVRKSQIPICGSNIQSRPFSFPLLTNIWDYFSVFCAPLPSCNRLLLNEVLKSLSNIKHEITPFRKMYSFAPFARGPVHVVDNTQITVCFVLFRMRTNYCEIIVTTGLTTPLVHCTSSEEGAIRVVSTRAKFIRYRLQRANGLASRFLSIKTIDYHVNKKAFQYDAYCMFAVPACFSGYH